MASLFTIFETPQNLRRPLLVMAFAGWNDAAEAATTAARYLKQAVAGTKFAEIDPEEFYHFGLSRPYVRFKPGSETEREIVWPATEFSVSQRSDLPRDLIIGVAAEPHLRWKTYCATVLDLAKRLNVSLVVTLGALLAEVPHTRPVRLVGGASDPELAARLGIRPTRYEGPTGIVGTLNTISRDAGLPTATVWANVPHYVSGMENPKAALALVQRVLGLMNASLDLTDLEEAARQYDAQLNEAVSQNQKIMKYIRELEAKEIESVDEDPRRFDAEGELPPADQLISEIDQFLRQQRRQEPSE
ncbi:MAG TPA: PAC2 family protein [Methylomirabilota bacterium]|nr:PAC2 family protein [Methylomirabilota bacterium]